MVSKGPAPHEGRRIGLCEITIGPAAGATFNDANDENYIRRYVSHSKHGADAMTLPDAILLQVTPQGEGWLIRVWEDPDR